MAQNASRLHRLLTLLDTGSSQATRFTAARQIGDIAKSHPEDLNALLKKVSLYLRSKNWDTRVAAAHAVGAIAENVKHITIRELCTFIETELHQDDSDLYTSIGTSWSTFLPEITSGLSFKSFDTNKVLEFGSLLLASGGQEYDIVPDTLKSPAERLAQQKKNLRRRLGLDVCEQFMDVSDIIGDDDLLAHKMHLTGNGTNSGSNANHSQDIHQFVTKMLPSFRPKRLSARELNLLKRKAKVNAKDHSKTWPVEDELQVKGTSNLLMQQASSSNPPGSRKLDVDDFIDEDKVVHGGSGNWPFTNFVELLIHDIFDPIWEIRHGSIMALREVLTHQGACAGVYFPDLSLDVSCSPNSSGTFSEKREREKNLQMEMEASEKDTKRQKLEVDQQLSHATTLKEEISYETDLNLNGRCNETHMVTGVTNFPYIKVEPESSISNIAGGTVLTKSLDDKNSCSATSMPEIIPANPKLAKLIKLAKHSYIKNWEFLQDCAIRFLCVLCLDRFGDYVCDQVVAPVRETCAQALGAVLKYMHVSLVHETLNVLLKMQHRQEWEVRHGSLLGIKYLVAVRQEMLQDLLRYVLPACRAGLEDPDDDVRAVAAEALIPTATAIASLKGWSLHSIVMLLWDILLDLDDLSPSTSSVMNLLAEIYSQSDLIPEILGKQNYTEKVFDLNQFSTNEGYSAGIKFEENSYVLSTLTPRLWPFMRHSISSVRLSAIRTLERLLQVVCRGFSSEQLLGGLWPETMLGDAVRIVFQNLIIESNEDNLQCSERVWKLLLQCFPGHLEGIAHAYFSSFLELATTPYGSALDPGKMFWPTALPRKSHFRAVAKLRAAKHETDYNRDSSFDLYKENSLLKNISELPNNVTKIVVGADSEKSVTHMRIITATALGIFSSILPEASLQVVIDPLLNGLKSLSGVQRQVASMVLISWFKELKTRDISTHETINKLLGVIRQWLLDLLACQDPSLPTKDSTLPYVELSRTYLKMRNEASVLLHLLSSSEISNDWLPKTRIDIDTLFAHDAINFSTNLNLPCDSVCSGGTEKELFNDIEASKQRLLSTSSYLKCVQDNLHTTVTALVAGAVVWMSALPARLNPIILPLMASIKREQEEILQKQAAEALAELIFQCVERKPSPNDKLIKNLCTLTCADSSETPQAALLSSVEVINDNELLSFASGTGNKKNRIQTTSVGEDCSKSEGYVSRRGSEWALKFLCEKFGCMLFEKLPKLWNILCEVLKPMSTHAHSYYDKQKMSNILISDNIDPQTLINNIQVVRSIAPLVDENLKSQLLSLLPHILECVRHGNAAVRLAASRCITSMSKSMTTEVMAFVIGEVIPMLGDSESVHARQGAGILVTFLVQGLGMELVPYAPLLVVPLLRCMSDVDLTVRQSVTHSFAALVPLLPLAKGLPVPSLFDNPLSSNAEDARFLEQLLDNSHIDDYKLPINLKVNLRRYQQEGINWLYFLKRFKLHGILCDDMGLGKTLQSSAIVAASIAERSSSGVVIDHKSLIVCPSTLVGHWAYEIEKYIDASVMIPLQYAGSARERISLRDQFESCNVIITSYDIVRKDIDHLGKFSWDYCILDEGHIIKSPKSKISAAVKQLKAEHRLILSGTPIQNNVLELWSLFDFLMPGFLGTERQFQATYGKPLLAAKDAKCSAKDAEAGALAMEALHKQVMPFLLRRTKDEVLSDLPGKIIQDRYCDLSPVQVALYEQFSGSDVKTEISTLVKTNEPTNKSDVPPPKATAHVFQALQYLLKLCSHPLLVLGEMPADSLLARLSKVIPGSCDILSELHGLHHSPKLVALKEILEECGVGFDALSSEGPITSGQHRVLIFAQHRSFLDIIERDLFQAHMKSVTYLRLDGSVEPEKRFEIVKTFNSDPTIDVLLLTTHIGGLGLNLTSADTLIFMEHDWNPMKDHQAMDRAHRIGQLKVVNVHRLIMRGTLEEKVMSLQKFKVSVANAVINAENASLKTMNTDQLLDLFTTKPAIRKGLASTNGLDSTADAVSLAEMGGKGLKAMLKELGELWDESQYAEEYDLGQFLAKLNG